MTHRRSVPKGVSRAAAGLLRLATAPVLGFAAAPPAGTAGLDPARAARDVFRDQEFWWKRIEQRPMSVPWFESFLKAVVAIIVRGVKAIVELLARLLRRLFELFEGTSTGGSSAVVWLVVALILAWSIWKLAPLIVGWLGGARAGPGKRPAVAWQPLAEASDLFEQAGRAFREGAYAEAIRLALLALIARLEKQGLLRYDPTRTNREYQRELRDASDLAARFGQVARIYERVWYGRMAAGRVEAEQAIELCGAVIDGEGPSPG